jgi:RNA polymerase sigma factor (sigma-70 family)
MLTSSPGRSPAARSARTENGSCEARPLKGFALCHGLLHVDGFRSRLEDVYRTRYVAFCRVVMPIVGDPSLAHDVVQEAFVRALRYEASYGGGSLEAWVWRIVLRGAYTAVGNARFTPSEGAEGVAVMEARDPALAAAIRRLPARQRLFVFLRYFADLTYPQIAEACDVAEGTVASALAAAHRELAASIGAGAEAV